MLNLLVSLLNDLYEELKSLAKADWCRAQVWRRSSNTAIERLCCMILGQRDAASFKHTIFRHLILWVSGELRHFAVNNTTLTTVRALIVGSVSIREFPSVTSLNGAPSQATTIYMNDRWHAQQRQQMNKKINHEISNDPEEHRWWCLDISRLLKLGKAAVDGSWRPKESVSKEQSCRRAVHEA